MWYSKGKQIRYDLPIFAFSDDTTEILLPQIDKNYNITGYNWFDIEDGSYTSAACFKDVDEAIASRTDYEISNGYIKIEKK